MKQLCKNSNKQFNCCFLKQHDYAGNMVMLTGYPVIVVVVITTGEMYATPFRERRDNMVGCLCILFNEVLSSEVSMQLF